MRKILFIIEKEFRQIFRNRFMLPVIFVMPVVQLFLLSYAANFEIKNLKVHVVDNDVSPVSTRLINKLSGSEYFLLHSQSFTKNEGYDKLEENEVDVVIAIPDKFEKDLLTTNSAELQLLVNAINGTKAGLANAYLNNIIADFNQEVHIETLSHMGSVKTTGINIEYQNWFNPTEDFKNFMVPGILVLLVTMIAAFLSGINIVREKEFGTIEQLNVTTIQKYEFIIGKLTPFWILAIIELSVGLIIAKTVFKVPFEGSLWLIYTFSFIYIVTILGLGMFISTISERQQQAMFISWFLMVLFILMSGLFTPIESMPAWAQKITWFNPIAYFITFIRMVMLKGSNFADVKHIYLIISLYAVVINALAITSYRKTSG